MQNNKNIVILKLFLTGLFLSLAALSNAGMDTLTHHYSYSFAAEYKWDRQFWDPAISWKNKYIEGDPAKQKVQMSLLIFSINKPSFLTDGWHLLKAIMLAFIFLSSVVWIPVNWWKKLLIFIGILLLWSIVFEIAYR
ncbi:MAG: hypothetical protein IH620_01710 [Ignavibacterium sp.]|nr:hypothetical protein [Ignavibacterium sp.]